MARDLHLVILAGGSGTRVGGEVPKQFRDVGGKPLLAWSVLGLGACERVASLTVTCPGARCSELDDALDGAGLPYPVRVAPAGETRTASTWNALDLLAREQAPDPDDLVAVHDAARPFASAELLMRLASAADRHGGAVPGVDVSDSTIEVPEGDGPARYLDRARLRAVQTPQVFRWAPFFAVHAAARESDDSRTDDGGLMAAAGAPPVVVEGEAANWKITDAADLARAADLLGRRS